MFICWNNTKTRESVSNHHGAGYPNRREFVFICNEFIFRKNRNLSLRSIKDKLQSMVICLPEEGARAEVRMEMSQCPDKGKSFGASDLIFLLSASQGNRTESNHDFGLVVFAELCKKTTKSL